MADTSQNPACRIMGLYLRLDQAHAHSVSVRQLSLILAGACIGMVVLRPCMHDYNGGGIQCIGACVHRQV
jgi:hypothetical protein